MMTLPYCKYNNSLNKYLFYSNLDIDLDNFSFYYNYNRKLKSLKDFFNNRVLSALSTPAPVSLSSQFVEDFSVLILDKLRINPFLHIWEETLANWPIFPGTSLLDFCRTQYEVRREAAEASAEALRLKEAKRQEAFDNEVKFLISEGALPAYAPGFARKIWAAGKEQKKVRKNLVTKIRVAKTLGQRFRSAQALAAAKAEVLAEKEPTPAQIQSAVKAQAYSQALSEKWATFVAQVRARRAAARLERENALGKEVCALLDSPLLPPQEKVDLVMKAKKRSRATFEKTPVMQTVGTAMDPLCPYMGLGARDADVRCWAISKAGTIAVSHPRLASAIYSWVVGSTRSFEVSEPIRKFIGNLTFLVDFYPEDALIAELGRITTEAQLFAASLVLEEEKQKLRAYASSVNCKANIFYKLAAGVKNAACKAYGGFLEGCEQAGQKLSEGICSVMIKHFRDALTAVKHELGIAMELIEVLISRVKAWYNTLLIKMGDAVATLGKYSLYAIAILIGLGLCRLIESCIGGAGMLSSIFAAAIFASIGLKCAGGWDNLQREMIGMCTTMARSLFGSESRANKGLDGNLKSIPIISSVVTAMTTFGTSLCSLQGQSVVEIGKIAGACHQIRMGKEAIKEFAATISYYLGRLVDKITGRETIFFDELSTLVAVDVRGWIRRAQGCILESYHTDPGCTAFAEVVARLVDEGHKLQVGVNGIPRKISADYATLIGTIMKDLIELHKRTVRSGCTEGRRKEPCWIYLWGQRHCGKSNFMSELDNRLSAYFDLPNTVANRNAKDQFFSGYMGQTFLHVDDLSAIRTDPPMEGELINLVSCQDYPLNMADVADKPIYFRSPFIISSSNFEDVPAASGIRDVEAYRARKACLIEMRRKPGAVYDEINPLAASQARFMDPMTQLLMPGMTEETSWMEMPDVVTEVINIAARHRAAQDKLQANFFAAYVHAMIQVALALQEFLRKGCPLLLSRLPDLEVEKGWYPSQRRKGFFVDGVLYLQNAQFSFDSFPVKDCMYGKLWEKRMQEKFLPAIKAGGVLDTRSMVVTGFLRSLVNGDCAILSVDSLSSSATACQQRIFQNLQLEERVYLRTLQVQMDKFMQDLPENPYSNSAWVKVLTAIASGREYLANNGCRILLVAAALLIVLVSAWGFWKLFIGLFTGSMSLGAAIGGLGAIDIKAQHSSQGQDKGYRSRNIPVHHRYAYARSQAGDGLLPAARLCVAIYQPGGGFVSAMQYKNKSIRMTRHQALRFQEGEQLTLVFASTGESQMIRWHKYHMREEPGSEIVTLACTKSSPSFLVICDLFLEDKETELPSHFQDDGLCVESCQNCISLCTLDTYGAVNKYAPLPLKGVVNDDLYLHEIPEKIVFHYESRNDDCGMILTCQIKGKMKVVGMLVAGKDKTSWGDILPANSLAELRSQIEHFPKFGEAENGYFKAGYVAPNLAPTMPKKTNMVRVPEELRVPCDVPIKEPSIISPQDPRCPSGVDPPKAALKKKFSEPMAELEQEVLDEVATEILETWYDCEDHILEDIPLSVAINGIPAGGEEAELENFVMKTSPGYPYFREVKNVGKGKHPYFEEAEDGSLKLKEGTMASELHENLVEFTKSEVPELVVVECPKDELLPERKIKVGACRLFEIMPLHYNLFLRQKTCAFTQFLQHNRHRLPCQVGTNAYSREWGHLLSRLMRPKTTEAINCDYSGFDGLLTPQLVETIAKMINRLYALSGESEVSQAQRYNMIMALCGRYALVGADLYKVNCGLPSGFSLTVVVNSVFNEILIRYAYRKLAPAPQRNLFGVNVCLLVYGDDNLISCAPSISSWFTGEAIRICLAEKKIKITDGSDKDAPTIEPKPFGELDFLKRKFLKLDNGIVQAPLDRSAIFSSLHWLTPEKSKFHESQKPIDYLGDVDVVKELILNVNVALVELYLHNDRTEFDRVRGFYVKKLPTCVDQFRTWAFCESFHSAQQTGMLRHDPAKVLDYMVGPDFARFMRVSEQGNKAHFYCRDLGVCGPHYKPKDDEFLVSTVPLNGRSGEYIPVKFGDGVGGLPTKKWVTDFGRSSQLKNAGGFLCRDLLVQVLESGKKLIFMSPAPYVAGNAAAICFGASVKMLNEKDALAHYRNSIPESVDGLERYFDAPIPAAAVGKCYFANGETYAALCQFKEAEVLNIDAPLGTQALNEAAKMGKTPCLFASQQRGKFHVYMVCDNKMCPHHHATSPNYEAAFRHCWLAKCKTKACQVSPWFGTKIS